MPSEEQKARAYLAWEERLAEQLAEQARTFERREAWLAASLEERAEAHRGRRRARCRRTSGRRGGNLRRRPWQRRTAARAPRRRRSRGPSRDPPP